MAGISDSSLFIFSEWRSFSSLRNTLDFKFEHIGGSQF